MAGKAADKHLLKRAEKTANPEEAEQLYRRLLGQDRLADRIRAQALVGLASLQISQRKPTEQTFANLYQAISLSPGQPTGYLCLARLEEMRGRFSAAAEHFERALSLSHGRNVEALYGLGRLAHRQRDYQHARAQYCLALGYAKGMRSDIMRDLARVHYLLGEGRQAETCYRQLLAGQERQASDYNDLGIILAEEGDFLQAIACYQQALSLHPGWPAACNNLGNALHQLGRFEAAREAYLALDPTALATASDSRSVVAVAASNRLFLESYNVLCPPSALYALHCQWANRFAPAQRAGQLPVHAESVTREKKRLRIGYVSPDLRRHPVGTFLEGLLAEHERESFEIYCYSELVREDSLSQRLQSLAKGWYCTVGQDDETVARKIYADGIDILVDLAGHTRGHRLGVFAWRPAAVQLSYLGYCTTTGLTAMDYWLTDEWLTPADSIEVTAEEIWPLSRCWLCYQGDDEALPQARDPERPLTFGSFNDLSKLNDTVIATWSALLQRLPAARLLLKAAQLSDSHIIEELRQRFVAHGIAAERLSFRARSHDYLRQYGDIDIALDPFPRTGGATTVDALWMAVPVITLSGKRMIERQGLSLLEAVGLTELIATNRTDYIDKAVALAADHQRLQAYHQQLRQRLQSSPVMDAADLARHIEWAYQKMWQRWQSARTDSSHGS